MSSKTLPEGIARLPESWRYLLGLSSSEIEAASDDDSSKEGSYGEDASGGGLPAGSFEARKGEVRTTQPRRVLGVEGEGVYGRLVERGGEEGYAVFLEFDGDFPGPIGSCLIETPEELDRVTREGFEAVAPSGEDFRFTVEIVEYVTRDFRVCVTTRTSGRVSYPKGWPSVRDAGVQKVAEECASGKRPSEQRTEWTFDGGEKPEAKP